MIDGFLPEINWIGRQIMIVCKHEKSNGDFFRKKSPIKKIFSGQVKVLMNISNQQFINSSSIYEDCL